MRRALSGLRIDSIGTTLFATGFPLRPEAQP